jgi:hypothetical protein
MTDLGGYYGNFISLFVSAEHANEDLLKNTSAVYNARLYGARTSSLVYHFYFLLQCGQIGCVFLIKLYTWSY